jgi:PAS domain S-box-containing protein
MSIPENTDTNLKINSLEEENQRLRLQLEELRASIEIQNNHEFQKKAQEVSKVGFWKYSFLNKALYCTNEVYSIFETTHEIDFTNRETLRQYISDADIERIEMQGIQTLKSGDCFDIDFLIQMKDGNSKYVSVRSRIERDADGNRVEAIGSISDISDFHFTLQKLTDNENLFRNLFNNLTDIFFTLELVKDKNGNIVDYIYKDANPVFEMIFNLPKEEMKNRLFSEQVQLFQQFHPIFKITSITREPYQDRVFVQSLDSFIDILVYSPSENLIATIWRDVTIMVEASSTLQESEEKYRQIFSIGNDGLFLIDFFTTNILDVNPAGCSIFGYDKDELMNRSFKSLYASQANFEEKIFEKRLTHIIENNIKKDGSQFPAEASLSYFNWSGRKVAVISVRDISERIKAQEDIIKSEKKFKQLFDYSNDAILILNNFKIIDFNQKTLQLFNLPADVVLNKTLWNLSPVKQLNGEDSRTKMMDHLQSVLVGNQLQFDWNFQRSYKSIFNADIKLSPILFEDEKVVQVILRDVSPQRKLEEERRTKEERWRYGLDSGSVGVWEWNIITNEVYFSSSWKKILGYEKDELENKFEEFQKRIHPDDSLMFYDNIDTYLSGKQYNFAIDFRVRCKNGTYKWINSKGRIYSYTNEGKPEQFIGIHTDITKYKVLEIEQQAKLNTYSFANKMANLGYWNLDLKSMIISGTEDTFSIFGFSDTYQTSLKHIEELVHPEDQKHFIRQFIPNDKHEQRNYIFRIIVDGGTKYIISNSQPIFDQRTLIKYEGIFQDISVIKKQEIILKDEQDLQKAIAERTQQVVILMNGNEITYSNNQFTELTGYSVDEMNKMGSTFLNLFVVEDRVKISDSIESALKQNRIIDKIEARIESKYQKIKWLEISISAIDFKGNKSILFLIANITERKNREMKLAESESSFKTISDRLPIGIAVIDHTGEIVFSNSAFVQHTEILKHKSAVSNIRSFFKEFDFFNLNKELNSLFDNTSSFFQDEFILSNGNWVNLKAIPLDTPNKNGKRNIILYLENIDIIKRQMELLTQENYEGRMLLENSPMGIGIINNEQKLKTYNRYLLELFGLSDETKIPSFSDFQLFTNSNNLKFQKILQNKEQLLVNHQTTKKQWLRVILQPIVTEQANYLLIFASDATEEKSTQLKTAEKLKRYTTVFEMASIGIALIDKNKNVILSNANYKSIWGINHNNADAILYDQLIPIEYLDDTLSKYAELFSGITEEISQNFQINTPNGYKWLSTKTTPYKNQYNEVVYGIQIIDDITQKRADESALKNEEKLKTLHLLANSFAHDFNNLLMSVYGNAYLLKSALQFDHRLSVYANNLFQTLTKTADLTHKLLSFSGSGKSIQVLTNVPKIISETIDQLKINPTITVHTIFDHQTDALLCDPGQLQRSIENILTNAVEAMPNGGELTITTKPVYFQDKSKNTTSLNTGKYLSITVTDTGLGIAPQLLPKIFDPFFTTKKDQLNAGIGLTLAKKTVEFLKGDIKIESKINSGTEVKIFLPLPDKKDLTTLVQPDEQLLIKGSANILVIDDEDIVRIVTVELIKKMGYSVFSFANPIMALQFYKEHAGYIDLVILDKQMPLMDGSEVYKKMKEINKAVRVILLTGYNLDISLENEFSQGKNKLIQKPVSIEKLSQAISSLLTNN